MLSRHEDAPHPLNIGGNPFDHSCMFGEHNWQHTSETPHWSEHASTVATGC